MEKYVVSRELAEKLKAAGYPQETTQYHWYREGDQGFELLPLSQAPFYQSDEYYAAPLTDELLERLPTWLLTKHDGGDPKHSWVGVMKRGDRYAARYSSSPYSQTEDWPTDALARLWLWTKNNDFLTDIPL